MDGLFIKVKTNDGTDATFPLRPRIIVDFEQKYGKGLAKLIGEEQKLEHIYYLLHILPLRILFIHCSINKNRFRYFCDI